MNTNFAIDDRLAVGELLLLTKRVSRPETDENKLVFHVLQILEQLCMPSLVKQLHYDENSREPLHAALTTVEVSIKAASLDKELSKELADYLCYLVHTERIQGLECISKLHYWIREIEKDSGLIYHLSENNESKLVQEFIAFCRKPLTR